MNAIKAQDISRHILKDKDKGFSYIERLPLKDSIEVLTKIMPMLTDMAKENENENDIAYFNSLEKLFRKLIVDKIKQEEHLWIVYCSSTTYPYMIDDDLLVLYDYSDSTAIEKKLAENGYDITFGQETPETLNMEIAHMYRNGYKNLRFTDGKDNMLIISREEFESYETFYNDKYITNPGLQNAMISFFQEARKSNSPNMNDPLLLSRQELVFRAMLNSEFMVPCIKEETDNEVTISHPCVDLTERYEHAPDEQILAIPVFTDGFEMEKCYEGQVETMLYQYPELLRSVKEIGASGIVINILGVSHYMSLDTMKQVMQ